MSIVANVYSIPTNVKKSNQIYSNQLKKIANHHTLVQIRSSISRSCCMKKYLNQSFLFSIRIMILYFYVDIHVCMCMYV